MSLKGLKAFDAAAYCASITAAKRATRDADKRQRRRLAQQRQRQQEQQQQQQQRPDAGSDSVDTSPQSDHHAADMGVRPEAGPDSPHAHHCNRHVAHVHAEAGSPADLQQQEHGHHHHGFLHAMLHSSGAHSSPGAVHEEHEEQQHDHEGWWRRALTRMHIHVQEGRRSA